MVFISHMRKSTLYSNILLSSAKRIVSIKREAMLIDAMFADGMFADGMFADGMFAYAMLSFDL